MDYIMDFVRPELLVLVPVLYLLGCALKKSKTVSDKYIPLLLGACGVLLAVVYVLAGAQLTSWQDGLMVCFTAVTQGALCAGASVYVDQLIKQSNKTE